MKNNGLNLPDFMVIGAARSGTTTLYQYLQQHPDIMMSTFKEPAFFAVDEFYNNGIEWYSNLFGNVAVQQLCGEASTHYTVDNYTPVAARRIYERLPHTKLIYILRPPIERLYSHYEWEVLWVQQYYNALHDISFIPLDEDGFFQKPPGSWKPWRFAPTFEKSLEGSTGFFIKTSRYIDNIQMYLKYFPRDALLCLLLEDLKKNPESVLEQIYSFLGVRAWPCKKYIIANQTQENRERVRQQLKKRLLYVGDGRLTVLNRFLLAIPCSVSQAISALLVRTSLGQQIAKNAEKKAFIKPLCSEMRANLMREFKRANQELGEFLGRDLSHWNE